MVKQLWARSLPTLLLTVLIVFGASTAQALSGDAKCESNKLKWAGKYASCLLKADSKAVKTGGVPDYSKCDATFSLKWAATEAAAGPGVCPSENDEVAMASYVGEAMDQIALALSGGPPPQFPALPLKTGQSQCDQGAGTLGICPGAPTGQDADLLRGTTRDYTDNGDGTITDNATTLTWEKLSDDASIHDKDNTYTWVGAFDTKIATLNAESFGGFDDWRLPNRFELETLVHLGRGNPAVDPQFHTGCTTGCTVLTGSCTRSANYASSTTHHINPTQMWYVGFFDGNSFGGGKTGLYSVRAVRGGK